jgi:MFS family permease
VTALGTGTRRGGLLWHRDFRLLWIGQGTSKFGSSVTSIALPLVAVATLGASTFQAALLSAAVWLPWLLIGLPAGAWVDRLPRRPVMLVCDAASLLMFVSVPVAAWLGELTIQHLLAVAFGTGIASVFFQTAYQVYLPTLLTAGQLPEGNAKLQGTEAVAQVGGPGAAGLVVQIAGSAVTALLLDAASFVVSALCLLGIRAREPERTRERRTSTLRQEIGEGIRFVARDPYLRVLTVFGAASNLGLVGYQAILVVFLVREVGVGPGLVGGVVAGMSLGGVIGAALATRIARRFGTARAMLVCELVAAPAGLLIPLARPGLGLAPVVAGGLIVGAGVVAGNVIKGSWRQVYTPHHLLGRVISSTQLVNLGTVPIGAVLGGALGTALGLRPAMWLLTGGLALTGLILLVGPLRRHRDLPSRPETRVDDRQPAMAAG